uniref:trimethyllysine dioxygenase n=1 Tax=Equus caballus TaxID=9796 RepID=A0A9L0SGV2_HORSE
MWCHRLSHLQSSLQDLLRGRVICWALQQPSFNSLFPLAVHWHHTASKYPNCAWQQHEDHFELQYANTVMRFDYVWLRDHCRSASCYNSKTHQRSLDTASVDLCIKPKTVRLDETTLFFTWPDGHVTRYDLDWLVQNSYEGQKQKVVQPRILWNAEIYQQAQVPSVDFQSFLETNEGLKNFLENFLLYGIAFVENVPPTQEHTEKLAERISLIRETIYGRMWYFTSDFSRGDTAYTKLALDRHTDTTYFQEPCGQSRGSRGGDRGSSDSGSCGGLEVPETLKQGSQPGARERSLEERVQGAARAGSCRRPFLAGPGPPLPAANGRAVTSPDLPVTARAPRPTGGRPDVARIPRRGLSTGRLESLGRRRAFAPRLAEPHRTWSRRWHLSSPHRTAPSRAEPSRAEPSRAEQSRRLRIPPRRPRARPVGGERAAHAQHAGESQPSSSRVLPRPGPAPLPHRPSAA